MLTMTAGAIASTLALSTMSMGPGAALPIIAMLAVTGALINGVQTTMFALAAYVYPGAVRATGVGSAVAFGRIRRDSERLRRARGRSATTEARPSSA